MTDRRRAATEDALTSALATGGAVSFACGPAPIVIALDSPLEVNVDGTAIDGGGQVTLDGQDKRGSFALETAFP